MSKEVIIVKEEDYKPYYKFGINAMLKLIEGRHGTAKEPIRLDVEDPLFGRLLRLLSKGNASGERIGQFDDHLVFKSRGIDTYIRVKCLGKRLRDQGKYKGENEL